jgi:SAM-dependent methyltransferase
MVEAARRAADYLEFRNAQFDVASADHLPFPADTLDAVVSRFGVMFFPSPVDAVREMLRVLKPGRKLALAAWHFAERNPFFYTLQRVVERYVDWPSPAPDAADPFRFAIRASYGTFLVRPVRWLHASACCNSQYKHRSQLKTFGHCEARCLRNFVKGSPCFQGSS